MKGMQYFFERETALTETHFCCALMPFLLAREEQAGCLCARMNNPPSTTRTCDPQGPAPWPV